MDNALIKVKEREVYLQSFFTKTEQKLNAIRKSPFFNDYLQGSKADILEKFFLTIAKSDLDIMQIRYLDQNGIEQIRVDKSQHEGKYHIVPKEELQDKSGRYYFYRSKEMPLEKVWFSKIDLNIEQNQVETPYKPTIRAMLPIEKDGKFSGVIIINYFMEDVLKAFLDMPFYNTILCNAEGYTIIHFNHKLNWGYYQTPKINLKNMPEFMGYSKQILSRPIFKSKKFVSAKLNIPTMQGTLIMIIQIKPIYIQYQLHQEIIEYIMISCITIILSLLATITAFKIARKISRNKSISS